MLQVASIGQNVGNPALLPLGMGAHEGEELAVGHRRALQRIGANPDIYPLLAAGGQNGAEGSAGDGRVRRIARTRLSSRQGRIRSNHHQHPDDSAGGSETVAVDGVGLHAELTR